MRWWENRQESEEIIIENGGDLLVFSREARVVAVYAGEDSPFSFRIGIKLPPGKKWGVATSSGIVGHSLSFGKADAVVVVAESSAVADAWATSLANRVQEKEDIKKVLKFSQQITYSRDFNNSGRIFRSGGKYSDRKTLNSFLW